MSLSSAPVIRYVNVSMNNPQGVAGTTATYDVQYDRNIVTNCQDNFMSVVNMSLPLQNLPLFIFPVVPNQSNPNLSTLIVGIAQNATQSNIQNGISAPVVNYPQNLIWVPQQLGLPLPTQDNPVIQNISPYYYCFSYQWFVDLVNTAIAASWAAANTAQSTTLGIVPVFSYNANTHTFSWTLDTTFTDNATGSPPGWTVFWNQAFDSLVNNFVTIENTTDQFLLENVLSRETNKSGTTITIPQDYPTTDNFNSAERIVVLSTSIPVVPDFFASTYTQQQGGGQGLSNFERVLVDVSLDFDNNVGAQRSTFVYNPTLYQYTDLQTSLPLTRISLKCQWVDSLGNFYDIPLVRGDVATVKLGFFNKGLMLQNR